MPYRDIERKRAADRARHFRNREVLLEQMRRRYQENKEDRNAKNRAWLEANMEHRRTQQKSYRKANAERIAEKDRDYREINRDQIQKNGAAWRAANKELIRSYSLRRLYGIDLEDFNRMLEEQGHLCKVCSVSEPRGNGTWHVDHCHETGVVRGLLCSACNTGIGKLKDSSSVVLSALRYLLKSGQRLAEDIPLTTNLIAGLTSFAASLPA